MPRDLNRKPPLEPVPVCPQAISNKTWLICLTIVCVAFGVRLLQWQNDFLTLDKNMTRLTAHYKEEAQFLLAGDLTSVVRGWRGWQSIGSERCARVLCSGLDSLSCSEIVIMRSAMPTDPTAVVTRLRGLLNHLVASRDLYEDEQEVVCDEVAAEVRGLPREGILEALDKAIGSSSKRREESILILSELTDVPQVVDRIGEWLREPDPQERSWLIQTIGQKRLRQFAPFLNEIMESDPDPFCRGLAIHAAGTLRADENLPALLRLAERREDEETWQLIDALQNYATEECRPYLEEWFKNQDSESNRVIAAWGLGKLGDKTAIAYLIVMLDAPDKHGPTNSYPGESIRAAQALCDIYQWPFEWHKSYVAKTVTRINELGEK